MSPGWEELIARVHGLTAHLVRRDQMIELARSKSLGPVMTRLEETHGHSLGVGPGATPAQAELAVRRAAAGHLATLARWGPPKSGLLTPFFLDEDRRSVQALVRGAIAEVPEVERISGLVPTPALPERALRELAAQRSVAGIAALLSAWNHPFGSRLLALARDAQPDLLRLDLMLSEAWILESATAVRRSPRGFDARRQLIGFVRDTADTTNAMTALQLAGQRTGVAPGEFFLPMGQHLGRETFLTAAQAPSAATAQVILERAFRATPLARAFAVPTRHIEDGILAARLRHAVRSALRSPLGAAPVVAFMLRLRAEVHDLCLIIWRLAAGAAPPAPREILSVA
jgi:vacuolar-type H+-ATPase subunit C/Vma6